MSFKLKRLWGPNGCNNTRYRKEPWPLGVELDVMMRCDRCATACHTMRCDCGTRNRKCVIMGARRNESSLRRHANTEVYMYVLTTHSLSMYTKHYTRYWLNPPPCSCLVLFEFQIISPHLFLQNKQPNLPPQLLQLQSTQLLLLFLL